MDRRKRGAAAATAVETTRATRASSKSPSRRSSRNRSPARNASPARTKSSASQRRSGRNKQTDNDTASETDDSKSEVMNKLSIRVSPLKMDKEGIQKLVTRNRKTPTNAKVSNISSEGDDEVASLTAKYLNNKQSAENPTPSDLSAKRSYSRSISRSLIDEEWSQSDASEKNDDPIFGGRITRSRSKTQNLLRREQSLAKDAAAEFGGSIGASAFIVLLPLLTFFTQYVCSRPECSIKAVRVEKLKLISSFFTLESGYIYLIFTWLVCILSLIPYLGVKRQLAQAASASESSGPRYFNGFAIAVAIVSGLSVAEYYFKYPIFAQIYKNYQQFIFVGFIYAIVISAWCFFRSKYVPVTAWNPFAKSGRLVSDLFIGREINPRWWNIFDIKLIHRRVALISTLIFNLIFLTRNVKFVPVPTVEAPLTNTEIITQFLQSIRFEPVAATVSLLIVVYVIDALLFEFHLTSSFELQNEGVGAQLLLQYAAYPVWSSIFAKFALQHKITGVPNWLLVLISVVFLSGLILKRLANELKYHYRVYPNSARSSNLVTLPTFQGQRLLIAKYWSKIRHPNLLGEIITAISLLPLLYFRFAWSPLIAVLTSIVFIVHRARRIDTRMAQHYNSAFTRYKSQVQKSFIPRVY
ncbi:lamin-B receptor [Sitodiplosis mosellana]|uniref:lamin-B receptor n=1 Tax=Sitodiplosis mosellana TaxID=263140 RepID=UPI002443BE16|nr:lamin-B receptor [Sitodiplosis mosellana]